MSSLQPSPFQALRRAQLLTLVPKPGLITWCPQQTCPGGCLQGLPMLGQRRCYTGLSKDTKSAAFSWCKQQSPAANSPQPCVLQGQHAAALQAILLTLLRKLLLKHLFFLLAPRHLLLPGPRCGVLKALLRKEGAVGTPSQICCLRRTHTARQPRV